MHPGDNKRKNEEAAEGEQPAKQIRFDYDYNDIIKRGVVPKTFIKQALMLSLHSIRISTGLRCNQRLRAACAEFRQGAQK